jgi:hypothetical protein
MMFLKFLVSLQLYSVLFGKEIRIRSYISGMVPELVLDSDLDSYNLIERI